MAKEREEKKSLEGFAASLVLPEGHELIIGELPAGTIIEVATWQGTGRPGDDTNRFLLTTDGIGMQKRKRREVNEPARSATDISPEQAFTPLTEEFDAPAQAQTQAPITPTVDAVDRQPLVEQSAPEPISVAAEVAPQEPAEPAEPAAPTKPVTPFAPMKLNRDFDSFLGVSLSDQAEKTAGSGRVEAPKKARVKKERVKKERVKKVRVKKERAEGESSRALVWIKYVFGTVASVAAIVIVFNLLGLAVTVPTLGTKTSFGSTTNSLVVYKKSHSVDNGRAMVSISKADGKKKIILGTVTAYGQGQVEISTSVGFVGVNADTLEGRSLLAIPYIGGVLHGLFQ